MVSPREDGNNADARIRTRSDIGPRWLTREHRVARSRVHASDKVSLRELRIGHPFSATRQRLWDVNLPLFGDHAHESRSHGSNVVRWPGYDPFNCGDAVSCAAASHVHLLCQRTDTPARFRRWRMPAASYWKTFSTGTISMSSGLRPMSNVPTILSSARISAGLASCIRWLTDQRRRSAASNPPRDPRPPRSAIDLPADVCESRR